MLVALCCEKGRGFIVESLLRAFAVAGVDVRHSAVGLLVLVLVLANVCFIKQETLI